MMMPSMSMMATMMTVVVMAMVFIGVVNRVVHDRVGNETAPRCGEEGEQCAREQQRPEHGDAPLQAGPCISND